MKTELDTYDHRILYILQQDATLSMDQLADRVHLSRNACWRRVKRLEETGVITRKVALLDPDALGLGLSVYVLIRTAEHAPGWLERFERAVSEMPEILGAHRMSGERDYVLRVRVADMRGYDRFYKALIAKVPLAEVSASFVMDDIKDTTALPL